MRATIFTLILLVCTAAVFAADANPAAPTAPAVAPAPAPAAAATTPAPSSTATTPAEEALGKESAKEIEKECKLIKDEKMVAKLNAITNAIAPNTQRPDVVYNCKILDINEINAMSIPGGTIYVTKGLLNAVESDDELAGVLAHEIAHNSLHHVMKLRDKDKKMLPAQVLFTLGAILANSMSDSKLSSNDLSSAASIFMVSQWIKNSILNGYSVEVETEADMNGIDYLYKSKKYSPIGLYSVILGFRQMEEESVAPTIDITSNSDHPTTDIRLENARRKLTHLHVPINLWRVVNFRASVVPPKDGATGFLLKLGAANILTITAPDGAADAKARANAAMAAINNALVESDSEATRFDVRAKVEADGSRASITILNSPVMTLLPADMDPASKLTFAQFVDQVKESIRSVISWEQIKRGDQQL